MAGWAFRKQADIRKTLDLINKHPDVAAGVNNPSLQLPSGAGSVAPQVHTTPGFIYKTPPEGLPGAVDEEIMGEAECIPYFIRDNADTGNGERLERKDDDGNTQYHKIYNISTAIPGDTFFLARRVFGVLVADAAATSGATIIFEIIGPSGAAEAASNHCDDKLEDAQSEYQANVLWRPCGAGEVADEVDGVVTVVDATGSFLSGREEAEVDGKVGIATYMVEDGGYECQWVITFIDWWREVQMITDVIQTADEIKFEVKRVKVWDDCDLDPIVIPLTDCTDTS